VDRHLLAARLGLPICTLADWRTNEPAWRRRDLDRLASAASDAGLATLGGQAQFRLNDSVFELFWCDYDPTPRREVEAWARYADRSWKELLFLVEGLPADEVLIEAARTRIGDLADLRTTDLSEGLWFVVYLAPEAS